MAWPGEDDYRVLAELLAERRPKIVGISMRSFALDMAKDITRTVRSSCDAVVVWGGAHPTLLPEECIEHADVVCIGEGEGPIKDMARAIKHSEPISGIDNLWAKTADGEVVKNPLRPLIQDLDSLPFPSLDAQNKFFIEKGRLYKRDPYLHPKQSINYSVIASRGCPYQCSFCSNNVFRGVYTGLGKYYRTRSPANIIAELRRATEHLNIRHVSFQEENFSTQRDWYEELFDLYKKEIKVPFTVELHPRSANPEFAKSMKDAGGSAVTMGIQSGSERTRQEVLHRPGPNAKILQAVREFHSQGISLWLDFIMNNPFETSEDLEETMELILSLPRPYNLKLYSLCYLPRTELASRALKEGVIKKNMLDQYSKLGFTEMMAFYHNSPDREHAFYVTLAWLSMLKVNRRRGVTFFVNEFQEGKHAIPRGILRFISRSALLKRHPLPLHAFLAFIIGAANRAAGPLRKLLSRAGLLRKND